MSTSCDYQQNGESRVWFSPSELQAEQPEISDPILRYYNFRLAQEPNAPDSKIMDGGGNGYPFITFGDARRYVAQSSSGSGRGLAEEIERHFDDPRNIRMLLDKRDCLDVIVPALRPPPVGDDVKRRAIELVGEFMGDCVATHWGRQMCALTERLLSEIDSRAVPARADEEWQLVPKEPTHEMINEGWHAASRDIAAEGRVEIQSVIGKTVWRAMLKAAPPLAQSPAGSDDLQEKHQGASLTGPGCSATPEPASGLRPPGEHPSRESVAQFLWSLLDDIDTVSDMAKGNDAAYRKAVERIQRRRFEVGSTDGYTVTFNTTEEG